ncbi:MAG: hypothetical protein QM765_18330 [Myxococcales bacterium]
MPSLSGQRLALGLLLLVPPLALAGVLALRSSAPSRGAEPRPGEVSTIRWPNGQTKLTKREWPEDGIKMEERCAFSADGDALGCAMLKNGEPYDGILVDFAGTTPEAYLEEIRRFDHGKRTGVWRTFGPEGEISGELEYDSDRLLSRKFRDGEGVLRPAPEPAARLPNSSLPPKSFPPKKP